MVLAGIWVRNFLGWGVVYAVNGVRLVWFSLDSWFSTSVCAQYLLLAISGLPGMGNLYPISQIWGEYPDTVSAGVWGYARLLKRAFVRSAFGVSPL